MGRVSTCQKNCNTIDLRGAQVKKKKPFTLTFRICINTPSGSSSRECCISAQDCFKGPRLAAVAEHQAPQVGTIKQSKVEKAISISTKGQRHAVGNHRSSDRAGAIINTISSGGWIVLTRVLRIQSRTSVPLGKLCFAVAERACMDILLLEMISIKCIEWSIFSTFENI